MIASTCKRFVHLLVCNMVKMLVVCNNRDWICRIAQLSVAVPNKIPPANYSEIVFFTLKNKIFV